MIPSSSNHSISLRLDSSSSSQGSNIDHDHDHPAHPISINDPTSISNSNSTSPVQPPSSQLPSPSFYSITPTSPPPPPPPPSSSSISPFGPQPPYLPSPSIISSDQTLTSSPLVHPTPIHPNHLLPLFHSPQSALVSRAPSGSGGKATTSRKGIKDFLVGDILGEGSYSTVYHVTDKSAPHKQYALKVLDKRHIQKEKKTKYVAIERDTLNLLDHHPGCIRLYSTFQDETSLYYLLEWAPKGEILKAIKTLGSFSTDCTRFYGAQILSAIEHMHSRGVIHRDVKPENILLDSEMRVKMADFGSAKILNPKPNSTTTTPNPAGSQQSHSFVGTAEYVSPELLVEKVTSKTSDLWAFGCILFQMITGAPPFRARSEYLTFQKITQLDYQFPDGFPSDGRDLVSRLLVLDPNQRIGGSPEKGGINEIKTHPFFASIDWDRLWDLAPPILQPGIVVANLGRPVMENLNPQPSTSYPGFYQDPLPPPPSLLSSSSQQQVVQPKLEEDLKGLAISSIGEENESESDEETKSGLGRSLSKRKSWLLHAGLRKFKEDDHSCPSGGNEMTWVEIYLPNELVIYSSTVNQLLSPQQPKVVVGFRRTKKKRQLVLTDYPRLLCVKEDVKTSKVRLKYEIIFKPLPSTTTPTIAVGSTKIMNAADSINDRDDRPYRLPSHGGRGQAKSISSSSIATNATVTTATAAVANGITPKTISMSSESDERTRETEESTLGHQSKTSNSIGEAGMPRSEDHHQYQQFLLFKAVEAEDQRRFRIEAIRAGADRMIKSFRFEDKSDTAERWAAEIKLAFEKANNHPPPT